MTLQFITDNIQRRRKRIVDLRNEAIKKFFLSFYDFMHQSSQSFITYFSINENLINFTFYRYQQHRPHIITETAALTVFAPDAVRLESSMTFTLTTKRTSHVVTRVSIGCTRTQTQCTCYLNYKAAT